MSNDNEALVKQYFEHFNNHDWKKMAEMYTPTAEFKDPSLGSGLVKQTTAQVIEKYSGLQQAFPDVRDEIVKMYPSGDQHVIVEFVSKGTAPDSTTFELPICTIFTFQDGKISGDYTYYDNFGEE
ncbi:MULTISPECIES: nuclear transport factor 2 family protein [unclassified Chitinophaga]|uniref:nuclear transport factor 2 family protein n=1 Tax=unclassified Chitinophaga TaxID=2619133 RepID=UPI001C6FCBD8|nr:MULTISPECIES: nuclear transport factor 2 family protein [unclassified Chitinophaga]WPV70527.1 nuclear transport factor 2 family protein [Chitinophaga sp. LS1]